MHFKYIFTVAVCLMVISCFAQSIQGTIKSQNGEAVPFANVAVLNSARGTVADKDGRFSLDLATGSYQLQFSAVGFATKIQRVEITGQLKPLDITLADNTHALSEVIVTADKVESSLQKTPVAITALNARQIEEYRVWNFSDLTALAPSTFVIEHGNSTGSNFLNFRGSMGFTNEQAVATYVDGVYQFDFYSAPLNFNNIERIEILRGPQGTLYGRNAFGGVLNVITKRPENKTTGYAELDFGNYEQQRYSLGFNTPMIKNKLFMAMGLQLNKRGAIYENPTLGTKNFDGRNDYSGNIGFKYLISEKWTIDLKARTEYDNDKGAYPWVTSDSIARNAPYKAYGNNTNIENRTNTNASLAINYFGRKFNFTSITAGIDFYVWFPNRFDYDFTEYPLLSGKNSTKSHQLTQEFRLSSPANAGRLKWTVGTFLFGEKTKINNTTFYEEEYAIYDSSAPYTTIVLGKKSNLGAAFYGQATYALSNLFNLTLGARYDVESRKLTQNSALDKDGIVTITAADSTLSKTFNAFTPKISLDYQLSAQSMVYLSYSKGFRIGGFNFGNTTDPIYGPEKSNNYEVGIKNSLLNNSLKVNLTAFYFQQRDQQVSTTKDGVNYAVLNVGTMNNLGLESEISAIPIKNLQIQWTASTSHSRYEKLNLYDATTGSTKDYKGNKAIYNPAVQSMLAAQYNIPFTAFNKDYKAFIRGEYRYLGEYQLNFDNSESQQGYSLINARAGITANHLEIAFWGRNLNDARYISYGYGTYMLGSPRMWGITLTERF